jgi:hypothetical protein
VVQYEYTHKHKQQHRKGQQTIMEIIAAFFTKASVATLIATSTLSIAPVDHAVQSDIQVSGPSFNVSAGIGQ